RRTGLPGGDARQPGGPATNAWRWRRCHVVEQAMASRTLADRRQVLAEQRFLELRVQPHGHALLVCACYRRLVNVTSPDASWMTTRTASGGPVKPGACGVASWLSASSNTVVASSPTFR